MTAWTKTVVLTKDTTSGAHNQTFTNVWTEAPKAIFILATKNTSTDAYADSNNFSFGHSDGTTSCCIAQCNQDNVTTQNSFGVVRNDAVIELLDDTQAVTAATLARGSVNSITSTDLVITWAAGTNTTAYKILVFAVGGSDITNAKVINSTAGSTSTGVRNYTGFGFNPVAGDIVFCLSCGEAMSSYNTIFNLSVVSFGVAMSTSSRWSVCTKRRDGAAVNDTNLFGMSNVLAWNCGTGTSDTVTNASDFSAWITDGVALNHTVAYAGTGIPVSLLIIKGGLWDLGNFTQKTSTGTQDVNITTGIAPKGVFIASLNGTAFPMTSNNINLSIGTCDGTTEGCIAIQDVQSSDPVVTSQINDTGKVLKLITANATAASSTVIAEADVSDMATTGKFTLNYTTADSTARLNTFFTLSEVPSGTNYTRTPSADSVTVSDASLTRVLSAARVPSADNTTVTETSLTRMKQAFRVPSTDSTTVTESSLTRVKTLPRVPTADSTTVSDISTTRILSALRVPSTEVPVISENLSRTTQAFRVPSADSTIVTEGSVTRVKTITRVPSADSVTAADSSTTRLLSATRVPATETVTPTDSSLTRVRSLTRIPSSDVITADDSSTTRIISRVRIPTTDSTTVVDSSTTRMLSATRVPTTETTIILDSSLTRMLSTLRIPSSDTVGLSENITGVKSTAGINYIRSPSADSVTVSESSLTRLLSALRLPLVEVINIIDSSLTRILSAIRIPSSDSTIVNDNIIRVRSLLRTPTGDSVNIVDSSLSRMLLAVRVPSADTVLATDASVIRLLSAIRLPTLESIATSENITRSLTTAGVFNRSPTAENVIVGENVSRLLRLIRVPSSDITIISENITRIRSALRSPIADSTSVSDVSLTRIVSLARSVTSDTTNIIEAAINRMLQAFRSPASETVTVTELQSLIAHSRALQDTIIVTEPLLNRIVTAVRVLAPETVNVTEQVFFQTFHKFVFDSVVIAEQLFIVRQGLSGSVTYATPDEVRPLLGNLGQQRTDNQINLAIDAAYDQINTRTNRIPPDDWKDTDHNFGIIKKLTRYIAAKEMALGIKDYDTKPLDMEIEALFKELLEYDTTSAATQDIVGSSTDVTYALNQGGLIWSTRFKNLRKGSSGENDTSTINPDT